MEAHLLTDSTGQPLTRAPRATAHQKMQMDGSRGSWFPPKVVLRLSSVDIAPTWPCSPQSCVELDGCRIAGLAIMSTSVPRISLQNNHNVNSIVTWVTFDGGGVTRSQRNYARSPVLLGHASTDLEHDGIGVQCFHRPRTKLTLYTLPLGGERQEANAAEEVAEESILSHPHKAGGRRSAQLAPVTAKHAVKPQ